MVRLNTNNKTCLTYNLAIRMVQARENKQISVYNITYYDLQTRYR